VHSNGGRRCRVHKVYNGGSCEAACRPRFKSSTSKSPRAIVRNRLSRTSCTCGPHLQVSNSAFIVNGIPFTRARSAIDMVFGHSRIPVERRRLGQERAHGRIDGTEVGGVEIYTATCMVRLAHAPHQRGQIVGQVTFSLELGLVAKHFGMSRAGQARSTRNSILYTEKIDLLAVYERSPSLTSSVPPFIR